MSGDVLQVSDGSLYPALHKLEQEGWVTATWQTTENNRRAKFYALSRLGRRHSTGKPRTGRGCRRPSPTSSTSPRVRSSHAPRPLALHRAAQVAFAFQANDVERDLDDEIRYHLEQQVDELMAKGVDRDEATRQVRRNFGGDRDRQGALPRCSRRRVSKRCCRTCVMPCACCADSRRLRSVAILTLALGIGANTAVFSLVDGILFAPLPYPAAEQLVSVKATYPNGAFAAMREEIRSLDVAAYAEGKSFTLSGASEPMRVSGTRVSAELLSILGVRPARGQVVSHK